MKTGKSTFIFFAALLTLTLGSCSQTEKSVSGIICDASMNTLTLIDEQQDTLSFSTTNAECVAPDGILLGDSATVVYTGKLTRGTAAEITSALRITVIPAQRTAEKLIGSWIEPIPGMPGQLQGIKLDAGGQASSINMATLKYDNWRWEVSNSSANAGQLFLHGQSIGNGQTIEFTDTLNVDKLTADSLILSSKGGYTLRYAKGNK